MRISSLLLAVALLVPGLGQGDPLPELPDFPGCTLDGQVPEEYQLPSTSLEIARAFLDTYSDILAVVEANYQPKTILCTGCSKGIGRHVACHWAKQDSVELIISLATTDDLDPSSCLDGGDGKIVNVIYDIGQYAKDPVHGGEEESSSSEDEVDVPELVKILEAYNVATIDLLLLNAVRDMAGPMRDWEANDIANGIYNNVLGQHHVWKIARDYLNPNFAVVFGVSSVAAKTRFFPVRNFYHLTKQMIVNLVLSYAVEEQEKQLNTNYAIIFNGDVQGTQFGIRQILPSNLPDGCRDILQDYGLYSNQYINTVGMLAEDIAEAYHVFYNTIAAYRVLQQNPPNPPPPFPLLPPQAFSVEPDSTFTPIRTLRFNHDMVPPEFVNVCYASIWDVMASQFTPCEFYMDPRVDPCEEMCSFLDIVPP